MNSLVKGNKPEILEDNEDTWTIEFVMATPAQRRNLRRYAHPKIRSALKSETGGRCIYCESRMHGITWENVEHILPKSIFPQHVVAWDNLTLACPVCNNYKSNYYQQNAPIINPYKDDVVGSITFIGSLPFPVFSSDSGRRTIAILHLDRADLTYEREKRIKQIDLLLEDWHNASDEDRVWMAAGIRIDARDGEFRACVEAFLTARGFSIPEFETPV
ncbi:hypothetical protein CH306_16720 [Rhodococcus sp. 15-725-2-2b]|uniref:HNH endonuclease n=1 Tax=unclassified Rhodococcus (in: high G+C Gram-positive bacteria) TaxID=192944 RepID=UPI000B9A780E|nr:hypothetical protein CH277_13980 [Rhodococcus sp. 06-469-3-2]OZD49353.1 hypothetical protein CH264_04845 [Rhodococcus sp. 06-1477-1A]OZE71836.1 hypothetical protein CH306_16720 [Rhodococcus sp. 15-725-2-2b]